MTSGVVLKALRDLRADERGEGELHIADVFFADKDAPAHPSGYPIRFSTLARLCLSASLADREELCAVSDAVMVVLRRLVAPHNRIAHVASRIKLLELSARLNKAIERIQAMPKPVAIVLTDPVAKEEDDEINANRDNMAQAEWEKLLVDINAQLIGFSMAWGSDTQMLTFAGYQHAGGEAVTQHREAPLRVARINKISRNVHNLVKLSEPVLKAMPEPFGYFTPEHVSGTLVGAFEDFLVNELRPRLQALVSWDEKTRNDETIKERMEIAAILTLAGLVASVAKAKRPFAITAAVDASLGRLELPIHERLRRAAAASMHPELSVTEQLLGRVKAALHDYRVAKAAGKEEAVLKVLARPIQASADDYFRYIMNGNYESNVSNEDNIKRRARLYELYRRMEFKGIVDENVSLLDVETGDQSEHVRQRKTCVRAAYITYPSTRGTSGRTEETGVFCYLIPASLALFSMPIDPESVYDRPFKAPLLDWKPDGTSLDDDAEDLSKGDKTLGGEIKAAFERGLAQDVLQGFFIGTQPHGDYWKGMRQKKGEAVTDAYRDGTTEQGRAWWQSLYFHLAKSPIATLDHDYLVQLIFKDEEDATRFSDAQKLQLKIEGVRLIMGIRRGISLPDDSKWVIGSLGDMDRIWMNALPDGVLDTPNNFLPELEMKLTATQYDASASGNEEAQGRWASIKKYFMDVYKRISTIITDLTSLKPEVYVKPMLASPTFLKMDKPSDLPVVGLGTANITKRVVFASDADFLKELRANAKITPKAIVADGGGANILIKAPFTTETIRACPSHYQDKFTD